MQTLLGTGLANDILVINLPPLGCIPAMLTMFPGTPDKYDGHGCLKALNKITAKHNKLLGESIASLRPKYPHANLYYGDLHSVYTDILKSPAKYSMLTELMDLIPFGNLHRSSFEFHLCDSKLALRMILLLPAYLVSM